MTVPKVSIGVPVYNGEKYLRDALDSLVNQDYDDFEIVISDNASTDNTGEICREYAAENPRVRYHRNEVNIGASPNYNKTFELSRGEYFKWHAHDDICLPSFIRKCAAALDNAPASVALAYPLCDVIDEMNQVVCRAPDRMVVRSSLPFRRLGYVLRNVGWAYSLWGMARSSALRRTRLMAEGALNDYVLLSEMAMAGEIIEVPEVLFQLRMHRENAWALCSAEQGTVAWQENSKATRKSRRKLLEWTDPAFKKKKLLLPFYADLYVRYLKGVHHARLPLFSKLLCYPTVPGVCYWRRFKNFGGTCKRRILGKSAS